MPCTGIKIYAGFMITFIITALVMLPGCKKGEESGPGDYRDQYRYVNSIKGVEMKDKPDSAGTLMARINFGEKVQLLGEQGDDLFLKDQWGRWSRIGYGNQTGWVFGADLSPFDVLPLKKAAADWYNKKYADVQNEKELGDDIIKKFTARGEKDIKIISVAGNFAVIAVWGREHSIGDPAGMEECYLWTWKDGKWSESRYAYGGVPGSVTGYSMKLFYLNGDKFPDVTLFYGEYSMRIFLGTADGTLQLQPDPGTSCREKTGNCGNYSLTQCFPSEDNGEPGIKDYTFDCGTDRLKVLKVYYQE